MKTDNTVKDNSMTDDKSKNEPSFLHEAQKEGRASGKVDMSHLDEAMAGVCHIINEEAVQMYKDKPEEEWPTCKISVYNIELGEVVPAGIGQTQRGKQRIVCGKTGSRKISRGREEALVSYYHLDPETKKRKEKEHKDRGGNKNEEAKEGTRDKPKREVKSSRSPRKKRSRRRS